MSNLFRSARWCLLVGLTLTVGVGSAAAQDQTAPVLQIPVNTTKKVQMGKKQAIAEVRNENPKVCRVQSIIDDPTAVLVTGLSGGKSRVTFLDVAKGMESIDVVVITDDDAIREQKKKDFLEQVAKVMPSAKINVNSTSTTTVVTGTVPDANSKRILNRLISQYFGDTGVDATTLPGQEASIIVPRVQQVELEVVVAVVLRSEIRNMNFNWIINKPSYFVSSLVNPPQTFANAIAASTAGALATAAGSGSMTFGVVGDKTSFTGFLHALRTEGLAKVLSEPRIVTLSGQEATILSGGETPVLTTSGQGSPTVEYREFGTRVVFTPVVLEDGKIQIAVDASLSNRNDANGITIGGLSPTVIPGFDRRSAKAVVQIEDNMTLAIGGLIQNTVGATVRKIPLLGDLPFFGTAFSSTEFSEKEEELLILVTPRLVAPMGCNQLPKYLPGRETRIADDFELFLTQIMEAPRGQREVCPDGRFRAAHMNGPTAGIYPCNDNTPPFQGLGGHGGRCGSGNCGHGGGCANGSCNTGVNFGAPVSSQPLQSQPIERTPSSVPTAPLPKQLPRGQVMTQPVTQVSLPIVEVDPTPIQVPNLQVIPATENRSTLPALGPAAGQDER